MIYFTADPHFGHKKIIDLFNRPFSSVNEMNEEITHQYNKTVGKKDTLVIIGDFCVGDHLQYRNRIACENVHLIWGNHDDEAKYVEGFDLSVTRWTYKIGPEREKHSVFCSHYPHCFWPASHHGTMHIYGHHHFMREAYLDNIWPERRSMDVGIEVAEEMYGSFRPFSEIEIYDRLRARKGHDDLEFYKEFQRNRKRK